MTTITHYTTYDLESYYRETKRLPRLSAQEEQSLIATLASAAAQPLPAPQVTQATGRLIEGHLGLATCIAIDLCPSRRPHLFPDLVQEANLALVQATGRFDFSSGGDFTAYIAAWMRGRVKGALSRDPLLQVDAPTRKQARQAGTLDELYALRRPLSLDRLLDDEDPDSSLLELLDVPPPETAASPPPDEGKRAQVEALLSYLSPRAQMVLRLRYGLREGDERPRSDGEIARELGMSRSMVRTTEHDAMQRLRALARGEATLTRRNGRVCISLPGCRTPSLSPEREAVLEQTCQLLEAQGIPLTARLLAAEAGCPRSAAGAFLRKRRGEPSNMSHRKEGRRQARVQRLEEAYAQLEAEGKTPSGCALARRARVAKPAALAFFQARLAQQLQQQASDDRHSTAEGREGE